jgi:predicted nucleic acid-binding protein
LGSSLGEIHIAAGVWQELNAFGQSWPGSHETAAASWVTQHTVGKADLVSILRRDLDPGEAESIALAVSLLANLILLDERDGRHAARRLGLRVLGTVGILIEAKQKGLIDHIQPDLLALRTEAGFYLSQQVIELALEMAGE